MTRNVYLDRVNDSMTLVYITLYFPGPVNIRITVLCNGKGELTMSVSGTSSSMYQIG